MKGNKTTALAVKDFQVGPETSAGSIAALVWPAPAKAKPAVSVREIFPPIAAICQAEPVAGTSQYCRCLVEAGIACGYRTGFFNQGHFCLHPQRLAIVRRTSQSTK